MTEKFIIIKTRMVDGTPIIFKLFHPNKDKLAANCDRIRQENAEFTEKVRKARIVTEKTLNRHFDF
jgi:hypothetical protein